MEEALPFLPHWMAKLALELSFPLSLSLSLSLIFVLYLLLLRDSIPSLYSMRGTWRLGNLAWGFIILPFFCIYFRNFVWVVRSWFLLQFGAWGVCGWGPPLDLWNRGRVFEDWPAYSILLHVVRLWMFHFMWVILKLDMSSNVRGKKFKKIGKWSNKPILL